MSFWDHASLTALSSICCKTVEMDNVGLNDQDNMLVYQDDSNNDMDIFHNDQDDSNNDMDVFRLDEDDVMNIDQDDSNNDMDIFRLDEDDVMNIDQGDSNNEGILDLICGFINYQGIWRYP
ncbi:hypothetical protein EDB19DRAFT_1828742 [Suillus lakei]|nr:hypothetical protein EDB19DRAFT_1828742 [Suillus lakei]